MVSFRKIQMLDGKTEKKNPMIRHKIRLNKYAQQWTSSEDAFQTSFWRKKD